MSRREFISPEGLRLDGRRANELRGISARLNVLPNLDGSSLYEMGNTRVLCTIHGPHEPRLRANTLHDRCSITVRFHTATFSSVTGERRKQLSRDRRLTEWARYVQETFETAIMVYLYPRSQIEINLEVLNADGGVLASAINATTLALIMAGIPLHDYVLSCSVGYLGKTALLDTNRMEEGGAASFPGMTMAAYGRRPGKLLLMTEDGKLGADKLENMIDLAKMGIAKIFQLVNETIIIPTIASMVQSRDSGLSVKSLAAMTDNHWMS